jgi:hypothetical protein
MGSSARRPEAEMTEPLPDPNSPLTKQDIAVYGVDSYRHPITGIPVVRPALSSEGFGFDANTQAYKNHLPYIRMMYGEEKYLEIKAKLDEFVANKGTVCVPPLKPSATKVFIGDERTKIT